MRECAPRGLVVLAPASHLGRNTGALGASWTAREQAPAQRSWKARGCPPINPWRLRPRKKTTVPLVQHTPFSWTGAENAAPVPSGKTAASYDSIHDMNYEKNCLQLFAAKHVSMRLQSHLFGRGASPLYFASTRVAGARRAAPPCVAAWPRGSRRRAWPHGSRAPLRRRAAAQRLFLQKSFGGGRGATGEAGCSANIFVQYLFSTSKHGELQQ